MPTPNQISGAAPVTPEIDPTVQNILDRREEIATHQRVLKAMEAGLSDEQKAQLAKLSNVQQK